MRRDGYCGCPLIDAVAGLANPPPPAPKTSVAHNEKRRTLFRTLLKRLRAPDPDKLATQLMILGEGAVAQALVHGDPKVARAARAAARVLLVAAGVHVPQSRPETLYTADT